MKPYPYAEHARYYDVFESHPELADFNVVLDGILQRHGARTVLDFTCGTGVQAIYLSELGYEVVAADLSPEMLELASAKCPGLDTRLADMRTDRLGSFDAVISIFNAVSHLTKADLSIALRNVAANLKPGGVYVFDVFNLDYLKANLIEYEYIDVAREVDGVKYVRFSRIEAPDPGGLVVMHHRTMVQEAMDEPAVFEQSWDMQLYTTSELRELVRASGLEVVGILDFEGHPVHDLDSSSAVVVARRP